MKRLHFARPQVVLGTAIVSAILTLSCGPAGAGLSITNASTADAKTITDSGGCASNGCIPLGTTG